MPLTPAQQTYTNNAPADVQRALEVLFNYRNALTTHLRSWERLTPENRELVDAVDRLTN